MTRIAKGISALLLSLLLPVVSTAAPATGDPVVYHSPDGMGTPSPVSPHGINPMDNVQLNLFLDYDNTLDPPQSSGAGTMCVNEDGNETCGFNVLIEMTTDSATFDTFTPAAGNIVGRIDPSTRTSLRVNGIDTNGMLIPAEIGTLTVDALDANQLQITVEGVHRVGAAGQLDAVQPHVIVKLPEPGRIVLLISGIAGLAALHGLGGRAHPSHRRWRR
jgi:hypothetical protein